MWKKIGPTLLKDAQIQLLSRPHVMGCGLPRPLWYSTSSVTTLGPPSHWDKSPHPTHIWPHCAPLPRTLSPGLHMGLASRHSGLGTNVTISERALLSPRSQVPHPLTVTLYPITLFHSLHVRVTTKTIVCVCVCVCVCVLIAFHLLSTPQDINSLRVGTLFPSFSPAPRTMPGKQLVLKKWVETRLPFTDFTLAEGMVSVFQRLWVLKGWRTQQQTKDVWLFFESSLKEKQAPEEVKSWRKMEFLEAKARTLEGHSLHVEDGGRNSCIQGSVLGVTFSVCIKSPLPGWWDRHRGSQEPWKA